MGGGPNARLVDSDVVVGSATVLGSCSIVEAAIMLALAKGTEDCERAPLLSEAVPAVPVLVGILVAATKTVLDTVSVRRIVVVTSWLVAGP